MGEILWYLRKYWKLEDIRETTCHRNWKEYILKRPRPVVGIRFNELFLLQLFL